MKDSVLLHPVKMFLFHCFEFAFHRPAYLADLVRAPALAQHVVHGILKKISQGTEWVKA